MFTPQSAADRETGLPFFSLKTGLIIHIVFRNPLLRWTQRFKVVVVVHQCLNDLEIIRHVGPGVQLTAWLEYPGAEISKRVCENPSPAVFFSPPRVRKVHVNGIDSARGKM